MIAMDEPTNYIDMETVDALAKALKNFRGGVMVITHSQAFVDEVCTEIWDVKEGSLTVKDMEGAEKEEKAEKTKKDKKDKNDKRAKKDSQENQEEQ